MKKYLKLFFLFLIMFSIKNVSASNLKIGLKEVKELGSTEPYVYNNGKKSIVFQSVQSMAITKKYIVIMMSKTIDKAKGKYYDLLIVYDKNSFKKVKEVEYFNDSTNCGHANGLTYNSKKNQLVCSDNSRHRFVIYDAENFKHVKNVSYPKISDVNYSSYNNISYDPDDNVFWAAKTSGDRIDKFDSDLNKVENINISSSQTYFDSDTKFHINQESCYYRGRLYLVNYVGLGPSSIQKYKPSLKNVANNDMIIYSYGLKGSEKGKKGNLIYNQKSKDFGHDNSQDNGDLFREVESLEFNGNTAYILFQRGGRFQVYNVVVGKNDINAKVVAKVKTNNSTLFKKLNTKASFKSKTSGFNYDKSIGYDKNYEVKNISISKYGKYKMNIKQNKVNSSNWSIDDSTIESTIEAYYDFNINKTNYNVSYKNANNTFKNTFTYTKISVPISVSANLSKLDEGATLPNLSATLYNKDNKKISTISMDKNKYKFNNLSYTEPGTYTYTIKQNIPSITTSGVYKYSFDKKEIKVTVKVTTNEDKLKYKVTYSKSGFDNKVTANYNECLVNNVINIQSIKNDNFDTPITKLNIYKNSKLVKVVQSSADKYNFVLSIKSPGVYKYELSQDTTISGSGNISYQYDTKVITLTITAKIVNNQLVCSSKLSSNSLKNKFVIAYGTVNAIVSVGINSTNNSSIAVPTTSAILSGNGIKETINSNNSKYEYSISLKKTGTYKYSMVQKNISIDDVDCDIDDTKIIITIVVSKNNGALDYTISYSKNYYENIYTENVDPINLMFSVNIKTDIDDDNVSVPVTTAKLYDSDNSEIKTATSSKGRYVFKEIRIEEEGTYTYKIKQVTELSSGNSNVSYELDDKEITIRAVVTNNGGTLKANTVYSSGEFSNKVNVTYSPVNVDVVYNIDNNTSSDAIKNIDLSASVYHGTEVVKNVNEENDKYSFNLQFATPGNYTYTIKQDNAGIRKNGMYTASIDNDTKTFIVHVTSDNLNLVASVEYQYTDNSFENDFVKTSEVLNIPISIRIDTNILNDKAKVPVTQAVIEEKMDSDEYDTIEKVSSSNGVYTFNDIDVVTEGVYTYKISQVNSGEHKDEVYYYSIDSEEVFVQVNVFENSEGKLTYNIHDDDYVFENVVDIDYDPINIPISVNINTQNTDNLEFVVPKVVVCDDTQILDIKDGNVSNIVFNNISINRQGKYNYKIFQSSPLSYNKNGIEYNLDNRTINVEVNVTADEDNKLKYTITYNGVGEIQTLNNEYKTTTHDDTIFSEPKITIDIFSNNSEAKNIETKATLFYNGIPVETVTNSNGSYVFDDLKLLNVGKYKYTIKQVPYNDSKWELDGDELEAEIEVYKDEQNQLQYRINYTNNVSSFTNLDDTVLRTIDDEDVVIDNFPNTGVNTEKILFILGLLLIAIGSFVLQRNLERYSKS